MSKAVEFVEKLIKKTEEGEIEWQRGPTPGFIVTRFDSVTLVLYPVPALAKHDAVRYILRMRNVRGTVLDEIDDWELAEEAGHKKDSPHVIDLYRAARRSATGALEVMQDIMAGLK